MKTHQFLIKYNKRKKITQCVIVYIIQNFYMTFSKQVSFYDKAALQNKLFFTGRSCISNLASPLELDKGHTEKKKKRKNKKGYSRTVLFHMYKSFLYVSVIK